MAAPSSPIYLDNHATTRLDPRVLEAMLPWLTDHYGNAGSVTHELGREARAAVEAARETFATAIGGTASEIVFTGGATESNNLALLGSARRWKNLAKGDDAGGHIVTVATEHDAVLDPIEHLERQGVAVTRLAVEPQVSTPYLARWPCGGAAARHVSRIADARQQRDRRGARHSRDRRPRACQRQGRAPAR
jgi:cysteine desulfurase